MFARAFLRKDFGRLDELHVASGMVAMLVRVDHVLHRQTGDGLHTLHDFIEVPLELVVDQDDAFRRDADGDIAPAFGDHVKVVLHPLQFKRRPLRLLGLNRGEPCCQERDQGDAETFLHPSLPNATANTSHFTGVSLRSPDATRALIARDGVGGRRPQSRLRRPTRWSRSARR
jgi:hypothetical protein